MLVVKQMLATWERVPAHLAKCVVGGILLFLSFTPFLFCGMGEIVAGGTLFVVRRGLPRLFGILSATCGGGGCEVNKGVCGHVRATVGTSLLFLGATPVLDSKWGIACFFTF